MKKAIQILLIIILVSVISMIVVFVFNPFDLRTKFISSMINSYLSGTIENYSPLDSNSGGGTVIENNESSADKHPLLNEEQEKTLENYGVDVSQLPSSITPGMGECFIEKLGQKRADEIVGGATPSAMEIFKTRSCLGQ
ncbi:hypothetical protein A2303_05710 [Candidatus Falkowbacteria bacterium RIFOXYB2_FULL_47_14]|uniref:Uncharacterized protein n=1 Tax=Candidatus Falkowbacteria bacterium RIFOXYA2_FULL_47_19 TaxID=1797994 RepID=A0A1F5SEE3_9BACT|nr:MAG: hypothetical protein A2227_07110 [Candidatus Falkowbacteria bacterium RIFOXYA2_FULL_47_19]OGF35340.1 MAG: hypothetical protein A2468_00260 [Candidatus Falkowbacteria bacterium RIFOXYC2_FULL_46_15]OGF43782.1 MAG: hypothetical protein A2303_05710 [Candidatus Falkowbacteria bacterium RIFOXYB2_FULL_47_14]